MPTAIPAMFSNSTDFRVTHLGLSWGQRQTSKRQSLKVRYVPEAAIIADCHSGNPALRRPSIIASKQSVFGKERWCQDLDQRAAWSVIHRLPGHFPDAVGVAAWCKLVASVRSARRRCST